MNHSLLTADRSTYLKIVAVALFAAVIAVAAGTKSRIQDTGSLVAGVEAKKSGAIVKAGRPASFATRDDSATR